MKPASESFTSTEENTAPQGLVDPERAIERLGGSRSLYVNVLGRFLDDTAGSFALLRQAVAANDLQQIKRAAHSLKGLAAMCGAESVHDALAGLETAGDQRKSDSVTALFERVDAEMCEAKKALQPLCDGALK